MKTAVLGPRIRETADKKTAKNESHLYFQCWMNKNCWSNEDVITEDTIETASHVYVKMFYKHNMTPEKPALERGGRR
jgi:hypothetical protein